MTHIVRAFVPFLAILILAACADLTKPAPAPVCPDCAPLRPAAARYQPAPFAAMPGWSAASLAPGLRAFATGCARMSTGSALQRSCEAARAGPADNEAAARAF